ncbi:MAG: tetratricopeptide repeat protein [Saccharospirillaceae bacterium]|nr:tetratricopeptide repeat protein [Pseudomonadales bacterium]NRB79596.1 tetratricopeptide repeat protein [Saccharospirillaceae bacterium]
MNIKHIIYLSIIIFSLHSCSSSNKKDESFSKVPDDFSNTLPSFASEPSTAKRTKDDFGVLAIKQEGPGYEINLTLDTGDENVNFTMDLPEQSSASKQLERQDNNESTQITSNESDDIIQSDVIDDLTPEIQKTQTQLNNEKTVTPVLEQGPSANDYLVSAQTQFYEDNYIGALSDIENAIKRDNTQALSYAIKGSILYKLGNKSAAKLAWEKALELNPKLKSVELSLKYLVGQ